MMASYDLNGNIQTLQRKGAITLNANKEATAFGIIDNLGYTYHNNSNQLKAVSDIGSSSTIADLRGFKDGNTTNTDYIYDANGNMTEDKNKDITIEYNHLNLPNKVTFGTGNKLEWLYDAAGIKLTKKVFTGSALTSTKEYAGGFEYSNGALEAIYFSEGRVAHLGDGDYRYEYSLKDHLGNTRVTFADVNNDGQVKEDEILQEEHYYPFGLRMEGYGRLIQGMENAYNYNGKELNSDFDLDWLDYGARWYDASIARWSAVDPLAEKYVAMSPYTYVANNPLRYIDPDGRKWLDPKDAEKLKIALFTKILEQLKAIQKQKKKISKALDKTDEEDGLSEKDYQKITKKIHKSKDKIDDSANRIDYLTKSAKEIDQLGADENYAYDLVSGSGAHHVVKTNKKDKDGRPIINIEGSGTALHIHEMKHVAMALDKRGLKFSKDNHVFASDPLSGGLTDEMEGYKAQYAYAPSSLPAPFKTSNTMKDINIYFIGRIKNGDGRYVYPVLNRKLESLQQSQKIFFIRLMKQRYRNRDEN